MRRFSSKFSFQEGLMRPEADILKSKQEGSSVLDYGAVTGLTGVDDISDKEEKESVSDEEVEEKCFVSSRRPKHEDKESKAEKRKDKVPKHVKKRKEKTSK